ncbi:MAG: agmatine deiminase family protein [Bacteroidota bacterium]
MKLIPAPLLLLFAISTLPLNGQDPTLLAIPNPPAEPVRTMAEWEEVEAVVITWTAVPTVLTEIVRHAVEECQVIIITDNPALVSAHLTTANISLDRVQLLNRPFNTIWIRDYGPWTVYTRDVESRTLIDWIYNRPTRVADDTLPQAIASYLDMELYEATEVPFDWVHAGGNYLVDGMGTAFSSDLVLDENPGKTVDEIDAIAADYLGTQQYVKLPKLPYDGIHHLDMHMRLLDEETLLVGEYPEGVADGPQIEANIQRILATLETPFGNPYRIVRIPMPPDRFGNYPDEESAFPCRNTNRAFGCYRTYTNSLFINNTILVPTYDHPLDSLALAIYESELPGYKVVGINCNPIIPQVGAVHCITKLIGHSDPLWMAHAKLRDTYRTTTPYPVMAKIRHRSGIISAMLHYRLVGTEQFTSLPLFPISTEDHLWGGGIPPQPVGSEVQYYISATALSGKVQERPMPAPEGYYSFTVRAATTPLNADFALATSEVCEGNMVQFANYSDGAVESWSWSFPGGTPATATVPNPMIAYEEAGTYPVSLQISNDFGSTTKTLEQAVTVLGKGATPFSEDFEEELHPSWEIINPTKDEAFWELVELSTCGGGALRLNNYSQKTWGTSDLLQTRLDLSAVDDLQLQFDVAYALNSSTMREDRLQINVTDCIGNKTIVYSKTGPVLATTTPSNNFFLPTSCEAWRSEIVDLSAFAGQQITVAFENAGFNGNMLYLDNIEFTNSTVATIPTTPKLQDYQFNIFPNPTQRHLHIEILGESPTQFMANVHDAQGKKLLDTTLSFVSSAQRFSLDISMLPNGTYLLNILSKEEVYHHTFVVQH